jgi:RNA polymerase sigma-70 factor (ECF subfamily)
MAMMAAADVQCLEVESDSDVGSSRETWLSETELANRFATQLVVVVDRQLSRYLRHKVEPEDISQSVFRSFFRRHRKGEFEFHDWNGVWGLLVRLAVCKCRNRVAFLMAQRRDVRREWSLDSQFESDDVDYFEPVDEQPFPDDQAAVGEVVESFLQDLSADDQSILAGHLAGHHSPKISTMVGCSEQTVRRRLQQMERRLRNRLSHIESIELDAVAM